MTDNPNKTPTGNETPTRAKRYSLRRFLGRVMLVALAIVIVHSVISANQNFSNRFKGGFYFEKYSNAKQARAALLKLHPIGSDIEVLRRSLEDARAYITSNRSVIFYRYIENRGTFFAWLWVTRIEVDGTVIRSTNVTKQGMVI